MLECNTKKDLLQSSCTTSGQETQQVYCYNAGARRGIGWHNIELTGMNVNDFHDVYIRIYYQL